MWSFFAKFPPTSKIIKTKNRIGGHETLWWLHILLQRLLPVCGWKCLYDRTGTLYPSYMHLVCCAFFCFCYYLAQNDSCELFTLIWYSAGVFHAILIIVWTRSREVTLKAYDAVILSVWFIWSLEDNVDYDVFVLQSIIPKALYRTSQICWFITNISWLSQKTLYKISECCDPGQSIWKQH